MNLQNHHDLRVTAMYRRLAMSKGKGMRPAAAANGQALKAPSISQSFRHLQAAPTAELDVVCASPRSAKGLARSILNAAAKARLPTGTDAAPPAGLAAKILAAGRTRRGENR